MYTRILQYPPSPGTIEATPTIPTAEPITTDTAPEVVPNIEGSPFVAKDTPSAFAEATPSTTEAVPPITEATETGPSVVKAIPITETTPSITEVLPSMEATPISMDVDTIVVEATPIVADSATPISTDVNTIVVEATPIDSDNAPTISIDQYTVVEAMDTEAVLSETGFADRTMPMAISNDHEVTPTAPPSSTEATPTSEAQCKPGTSIM
jgi:hypothetical protein